MREGQLDAVQHVPDRGETLEERGEIRAARGCRELDPHYAAGGVKVHHHQFRNLDRAADRPFAERDVARSGFGVLLDKHGFRLLLGVTVGDGHDPGRHSSQPDNL